MYLESVKKEVAFDIISLQIALNSYNSYIQRLFLALDSTNFILKPLDAVQLATDFKTIKKFKWRLENNKVKYFDKHRNEFYLNLCNDIISNYRVVLELESSNGGNLPIATRLVNADEKEIDLSIFNYESKLLDVTNIKEL